MAKVLVVEDKPEELEKARIAIEANGHEAILTQDIRSAVEAMVDGVDWVITDLHFNPFGPEKSNINPQKYFDDPPPSGLEVVIAAVHLGIPVAICTDTNNPGGHHGEALSWIFDAFIGQIKVLSAVKPLHLIWIEYKKWHLAVKCLEQGWLPGE